jgi:thiamine-phosphate pyrophosphorylase
MIEIKRLGFNWCQYVLSTGSLRFDWLAEVSRQYFGEYAMSSAPLFRILDASLNRASEGLRVVEDYVRFVLDDPFLTSEFKSLRHDLAAAAAALPTDERHAARDTPRDVGTALSTPAEQKRSDIWSVCAANLKRTEQSLRSLEEFGKLTGAAFAQSIESLRYLLYTLEKAIDVSRSSRERLKDVRLCVLIDSRNSTAEFEQLVRALVKAGVGMIQLRDKQLDDRELLGRARLLVSLTRAADRARRQPPAPPGVRPALDGVSEKSPAEAGAGDRAPRATLAVINDRADIAVAVDADGVHVGQEDLPVKEVRTIVGTRMLIGVSTHNIEQARAAVLDGANYLGAGPTFVSQTKSFEAFAGLEYLRAVSAETRLPIFAIGGIDAASLPDVLATGVSRVAVGSAVAAAREPVSAARELLSMLK